MISILLALATAHFLADFWLQNSWMVTHKARPLAMAAHLAVVAATAAVLLGWLAFLPLTILVGTHGIMDWIKVRWMNPGLRSFVIDQLVHLAVIGALALVYSDAASRGVWSLLPPHMLALLHLAMLTLAAGIATTSTGAILVGHVLKPLAATHVATGTSQIAGLTDGGLYIGWLERPLTLLFVAVDQPTGVGILLAAKSILRFGDIKDSSDRARAEYIMIGTFLSIGWALTVAFVARKAAAHLTG